MSSGFVTFAAVSAAIAVLAGAFAAHGLDPAADAARIDWLRTGAQYQMAHALGILAVAALRGPRLACWCFIVGTVFFSFALYALAISGFRPWGAVAPVGGLAFVAGWLALAVQSFRNRRSGAGNGG